MKSPLKLLLIAAVITPFLAADVCGQRPLEKLQRDWDKIRPRGRILREIFGENEDQAKKAEEARRKAQQAQQKKGQPTPASPRNNRDQANRNSNARGQVSSNVRLPQTPNRNAYGNAGAKGDSRSSNPRNASKAKHPTRLEFLLKESKKPKGLAVEKIEPSGAAYLAGIRRGDVLLSIGGLAVANNEDVSSITSIMKDGDQIEFEVSRRGKKEKMLVQFGDPPVDDSAPGADAPSNSAAAGRVGSPSRSTNGNPSLQSVLNSGNSTSNVPRGQDIYARPSSKASNTRPSEWPVQPPTASSRRSGAPAVRPATERPTMVPRTDAQVRELNRQLELQRLEIEQLRRKLQQNQSGQSSTKEKDPLLDFDS